MSHIIKSEADIQLISENLDILRKNESCDEIIEKITISLIPDNKSFPITLNIGEFSKPAFFNIVDGSINISPQKLKEYILHLISEITKFYPLVKKEDLFNYLVLLVISHEIEHSYQYLIGNKHIDFPYQFVIEAYKNMFYFTIDKEQVSKQELEKILYLLSKYVGHPKKLMERNANVEAYDLLCQLSDYEQNKNLNKFFELNKKQHLTYGYKGYFNGAVEDIYKRTNLDVLYESFPKNEEIPIEDRVRYGLPIDFKTRLKVLSKRL